MALKAMPAWAAVGSQISRPVTAAATAARMSVRIVGSPFRLWALLGGPYGGALTW